MPVNTSYLESTPTVLSGLSLNGTGTISALTIKGVSTISAAALTLDSTLSVGGAITGSAAATLNSTLSVGGAVTMQGAAQVRSAFTALGWAYAGLFFSSTTTAQSLVTSKMSQNGQIMFSILSLTSNGCEMGYRSGNTVYKWSSDLAG